MSERFAWIFDKTKQKKVWVADMWSRKAVLAIRTAITGITSRLTTIENAGYQTASDVSAAIASAIGGITELEYLVVSTLPASGTKGVVYLVPHQHGTRDIYDEYIWVNNAFEKIGSTDVDLSQYLLKTDISAWAKASTKPSYTATEVGAIPNTTHIPTKTSDLTNDSGFITASSVPSASSATPAMDGTASAGSSTAWARGDHVHPHDTSKQDTLTVAQLAAANSGITSNDLAVNDASVLCTVTPIVPTLDAGSHYATYGGCWYYKIGSRVHVHIGVTGLTANTSTTLWQMPAGYIPYSGIAFDGQATTYNNVARFRVTGTGAVIVSSAAGNATGYCEYDAFS